MGFDGRANKRWVSIYGGECLRSEVMVFGNRSEEAWDRRGVDERSNSQGFVGVYRGYQMGVIGEELTVVELYIFYLISMGTAQRSRRILRYQFLWTGVESQVLRPEMFFHLIWEIDISRRSQVSHLVLNGLNLSYLERFISVAIVVQKGKGSRLEKLFPVVISLGEFWSIDEGNSEEVQRVSERREILEASSRFLYNLIKARRAKISRWGLMVIIVIDFCGSMIYFEGDIDLKMGVYKSVSQPGGIAHLISFSAIQSINDLFLALDFIILGFCWLYLFLGFILFWFLIVLVEVMPQSSMVSQGSHGNIMSNMVNNSLSVFILAFYVGFNSQILYVSYIICVIEILIKGMYRLDMMVIDGGRNLLRLWFFFRLYLGFEFLGLSFGGIYIVDWEVLLLEFEIVSVAVWSWTTDQRGFRLKTIEERRSGEGVFNRWFSGDRRRRALSTLPWAIVGGRNISKSYDVGRLILDFECMEWSFIGCNKRFYNSLISGFSWLDVDTLRVRISMVNCNLVSLRNNQGNEGHNPTHHGTVKRLTGGRNPLNRKVDNK
ncbi:predicted protein [Arabidopsis lyrata subsp. lyrata]|uniref:Predicted protein n=1 Tax=Arabidopsis lyrata subsp. lyrata TaxID=81972 RepID=D7L1X7_ARALL|nr:predicted protein [Arabidopsis lyrata subsp. lyrata]